MAWCKKQSNYPIYYLPFNYDNQNIHPDTYPISQNIHPDTYSHITASLYIHIYWFYIVLVISKIEIFLSFDDKQKLSFNQSRKKTGSQKYQTKMFEEKI